MTTKSLQVNVKTRSEQIASVLAGAEYDEISYVQTKWYRQTPALLCEALINFNQRSVIRLFFVSTFSYPCPKARQMCLSSPRLLSSTPECQ